MAYKVGSRVQMTFFPPVIDDYVIVDEAELLDQREEDKGPLVKVKKELMEQEKLRATIEDVASALKGSG